MIAERAMISKDAVAHIFPDNKCLANHRRCEAVGNPLVFVKRDIGKVGVIVL